MCPLGAIAMSRAGNENGGEKYIVCTGALEFRHKMATTNKATSTAQATSHAIASLDFGTARARGGTIVCVLLSVIHFSSLAMSLALCHRSSSNFARHFRMT